MGAVWTALAGVLIAVVLRILVGLGIGFATFGVALPSFSTYLTSYFSTLPPDILNMLGILRIDQCFTLIFSAVAARMVYKIVSAPLVALS